MPPGSTVLFAKVAQTSTPAAAEQPSETDVLRTRIRDLEAQLQEATTHRGELQAFLAKNPPIDNLGSPSLRHQLVQVDLQVKGLDVRILNLQSDLRLTKARLEQVAPGSSPVTPAPGSLVPPATPVAPQGQPGLDIPWLALMFVALVPLALAIAWRVLHGGKDVVRRAEWLASEERIQRIEDAVEGIAKEVEQMSEGQRFLTNVLSEAPSAVTLPTPEREKVSRNASD